MGFTKLDEGILRSSIMAKDSDTFKVWIALLASCDYDGIARVSAIFLSSVCHLPIKIVEKALFALESPDKHSRSTEDDGRRIKRVSGGYFVINYTKYRGWTYSQKPDAIRQRRHRAKRDTKVTKGHDVVTVCDPSASASASSSSVNKNPKGEWDQPFELFKKEYPKESWERTKECRVKFVALCKRGDLDKFRKACKSYGNFMDMEHDRGFKERRWMSSKTFMNNWEEWYEKDVGYVERL